MSEDQDDLHDEVVDGTDAVEDAPPVRSRARVRARGAAARDAVVDAEATDTTDSDRDAAATADAAPAARPGIRATARAAAKARAEAEVLPDGPLPKVSAMQDREVLVTYGAAAVMILSAAIIGFVWQPDHIVYSKTKEVTKYFTDSQWTTTGGIGCVLGLFMAAAARMRNRFVAAGVAFFGQLAGPWGRISILASLPLLVLSIWFVLNINKVAKSQAGARRALADARRAERSGGGGTTTRAAGGRTAPPAGRGRARRTAAPAPTGPVASKRYTPPTPKKKRPAPSKD